MPLVLGNVTKITAIAGNRTEIGIKMSKMNFDEVDRLVLHLLQKNARAPVTELAKRVGLSMTPVTYRIRHKIRTGLISGYRAILPPLKLNLSHVTYVEVCLSGNREAALKKFNEAVKQITEVEECYMIAGDFDYLVKVRSRYIADYRRVMGDCISALPYVASTSSNVAMEAVIENAAVEVKAILSRKICDRPQNLFH